MDADTRRFEGWVHGETDGAWRAALRWILALGLALGAWAGHAAAADAPWEQEVERARREQDRLLQRTQDDAERRNLVTLYRNRAMARSSALNQYLLGRVLFYVDREEEAQAPMQEALRLDPGFWFAELGLAQMRLRSRDLVGARHALNSVRGRKPDDLNALKMDAQLCVAERAWPRALELLTRVLAATTDRREQMGVRHLMAECAMELEQWETARGLIESLRRDVGDDPVISWQYAVVLYQLEQDEDVLRLLERLLREAPASVPALNLQQAVLARQERWDEWIEVLRRLEPLLPEGEGRERVRDNLAAHARGQRPGAPVFERDPMAELLQRATHPTDATVRRAALHLFYEADLPYVDAEIFRRYSPDVEPDPRCRMLVMRILGRFRQENTSPDQASQVLIYLAFGLDDPASLVRKVAAEELGQHGNPSALIYLLSALVRIPLEPLPEDPELRLALEEEFNGLRLALGKVSGRADLGDAAGGWVGLAEALQVQSTWRTWGRGAEARGALLGALSALGALKDPPGLWMVSWALQFVLEPYGDEIAVAAYRLMRDEHAGLSAEQAQRPISRDFPRISDEAIVKDGVATVRERVKAWWRHFLEQRSGK